MAVSILSLWLTELCRMLADKVHSVDPVEGSGASLAKLDLEKTLWIPHFRCL